MKHRPSRERLAELSETKTIREIANLYGVSTSSVDRWKRKHNISTNGSGGKQLKKFDRESEELPYVIGAFLGDGWIKNHGTGLSVALATVLDEFAESFAFSLREVGVNTSRFAREWETAEDGIMYFVQGYSTPLARWLQKISENYNLVGNIVNESERRIIRFIRGFYEAEGCYYSDRGYEKVDIANSDLELLGLVSDYIEKIGVNVTGIHQGNGANNTHHLRIDTSLEARKFIEKIKPTIKKEA